MRMYDCSLFLYCSLRLAPTIHAFVWYIIMVVYGGIWYDRHLCTVPGRTNACVVTYIYIYIYTANVSKINDNFRISYG